MGLDSSGKYRTIYGKLLPMYSDVRLRVFHPIDSLMGPVTREENSNPASMIGARDGDMLLVGVAAEQEYLLALGPGSTMGSQRWDRSGGWDFGD